MNLDTNRLATEDTEGDEMVSYNDGSDGMEGDCASLGVPTVALVVVKTDGRMASFSARIAPLRLELAHPKTAASLLENLRWVHH